MPFLSFDSPINERRRCGQTRTSLQATCSAMHWRATRGPSSSSWQPLTTRSVPLQRAAATSVFTRLFKVPCCSTWTAALVSTWAASPRPPSACAPCPSAPCPLTLQCTCRGRSFQGAFVNAAAVCERVVARNVSPGIQRVLLDLNQTLFQWNHSTACCRTRSSRCVGAMVRARMSHVPLRDGAKCRVGTGSSQILRQTTMTKILLSMFTTRCRSRLRRTKSCCCSR